MLGEFLIKAVDLSKHYQMGEVQVKALQDVSFEVTEGELVVILGPSGSGKSTLLNIVGGMDVPTTGQVLIEDTIVTEFNEQQLTGYRRHDVGFVFQFYNLMANLTARENIELATEICEDPLDIDQVIAEVGLDERKDHFPAQLSGGEQQRVAIARAVAKNPRILLCDEPTGALDYETGKKILALLRKINSKMGKTVMVITHNAAIGLMADRVIKMRSGRIQENYLNSEPLDPDRIEW